MEEKADTDTGMEVDVIFSAHKNSAVALTRCHPLPPLPCRTRSFGGRCRAPSGSSRHGTLCTPTRPLQHTATHTVRAVIFGEGGGGLEGYSSHKALYPSLATHTIRAVMFWEGKKAIAPPRLSTCPQKHTPTYSHGHNILGCQKAMVPPVLLYHPQNTSKST